MSIRLRVNRATKATTFVFLLTTLYGVLATENAVSKETARSDDETRRNTWNTFTYVIPEISDEPKVVLYDKEVLGNRPIIAIWDNGKIVWLEAKEKEQDVYFVSKIPVRRIDEALDEIKKFTARIYTERVQAVATRSCPMDDPGEGLNVLDSEMFITHLWSDEVLGSLKLIKKLLSTASPRELAEYFQARLARPITRNPWHFLAERYHKYTDLEAEVIVGLTADDPRSKEVFKTIGEHLVKDGEHFLFCQKAIRSLIPEPQPDSPLVSKRLDFSYHRVKGKFHRPAGSERYVFSYRLWRPETDREE